MMDARAYLSQFYSEMDAGSQALMRFFASAYHSFHTDRMLEFGGGPTLYSLISAARCVNLIHFVDHNANCLGEVEAWLRGAEGAFDWTHFIREALRWEAGGKISPSRQSVQKREQLMRSRAWKLSRCDAFQSDSLLGSGLGRYGIVATNFCLEGITNDKRVWLSMMRQLAALVDDDGLFVTVTLAHASGWSVSNDSYPAVYLELADLEKAYRALRFSITASQSVPLPGRSHYDGFHMIFGRREY